MAAGYLEAFGGGNILDLASSNTCTVCSGMAAANGPELTTRRPGRILAWGAGG